MYANKWGTESLFFRKGSLERMYMKFDLIPESSAFHLMCIHGAPDPLGSTAFSIRRSGNLTWPLPHFPYLSQLFPTEFSFRCSFSSVCFYYLFICLSNYVAFVFLNVCSRQNHAFNDLCRQNLSGLLGVVFSLDEHWEHWYPALQYPSQIFWSYDYWKDILHS